MSGYATFDNNPIASNDPDGDEPVCPTCPTKGEGSEQGSLHSSTDTKPFQAPNGQQVSGTDGKGFSLMSSDKLSTLTWLHTGERGWQAVGFETKSGSRYTWNNEKNWYTDANGDEFDDHASFDVTNMVGGAVSMPIQIFTDKVQNDDAFKSFKDAYQAHGGSVSSFVWDGFKASASDLVAGGHTGTQALGSLYMGFLASGGGRLPSGAARTSMNAYKHSFKYADRVRVRGVQDPVSHNFPYSFDDGILSTQPRLEKNGYRMYQQSGTMNGKNGVFEIGLTTDNIIDHRFFRPTSTKK